ncbi:MAG: M91 family zinc metallopeptidase [Acidobacteriota bacterium]
MSTPTVSEAGNQPVVEPDVHLDAPTDHAAGTDGAAADSRPETETQRADQPVDDRFESQDGGDDLFSAATERSAPPALDEAAAADDDGGGDVLARLTQSSADPVAAPSAPDGAPLAALDAVAVTSAAPADDAVATTPGDVVPGASLTLDGPFIVGPDAVDATTPMVAIDASAVDALPTTPMVAIDAGAVDALPDDGLATTIAALPNDTVFATASTPTPVHGYTPPEGLTRLRFYEEPSVDEGGRTKTWLVAEGTGENDDISVRQLENGDLEIGIAERSASETPATSSERATVPSNLRFDLRVRGGFGDDRIVVDDSVTGTPTPNSSFVGRASILYEGGFGDDTLIGSNNAGETFIGGFGNDTIDGRGGDDYIEGGVGNDIIDGGTGRDVLYGGQDQDTIRGGDDRDYIDGGKGHDEIWGGDGNDTLAGGQGNDRVRGEGGIDTLMGNSNLPGQAFVAPDGSVRTGDILDGGDGSDRMIFGPNTEIVADARDAAPIEVDPNTLGPNGDLIGTSVEAHGSAEFTDRIEDDLEVIRSTEAGQELLDRLDATGKRIGIFEQEEGNNAYAGPLATPTPSGFDASAFMDPQRYDLNAVPVAVRDPEEHFLTPSSVLLQHELFHDWDFLAGGVSRFGETNNTPNLELRAVGLPYDQTRDGIPDAAPAGLNGITENSFRTELGMPLRNHSTRPGDIENFAGDAFAPYRERELPGINPPEYDAPYQFRPEDS